MENDDTLRQVLEKIEYHKYTAIPMLNKNGKYVGTVTEGDLLRYIKEKWFLNIREAEDCSISRVPLRWKYQTVDINCNMEDLVDTAMKQNLVPVLDDADNFIGIVRRSDILKYCYKQSKAGRQKQEEAGTELIILEPKPRENADTAKWPCVAYVQGSAFHEQWLWNNIPRHLRLAQKGYVVAVIQYRPSDIAPFPAQMQDAKTAIRFLKNMRRNTISIRNIWQWQEILPCPYGADGRIYRR